MELKDLIVDLRQRGARFWIEKGRIHSGGPTGVLTEEIGSRIGVRSVAGFVHIAADTDPPLDIGEGEGASTHPSIGGAEP